jgi:hypothetical protein
MDITPYLHLVNLTITLYIIAGVAATACFCLFTLAITIAVLRASKQLHVNDTDGKVTSRQENNETKATETAEELVKRNEARYGPKKQEIKTG